MLPPGLTLRDSFSREKILPESQPSQGGEGSALEPDPMLVTDQDASWFN
jgi:hypothetical protein